jgi:small subunit ribosomal protein S12
MAQIYFKSHFLHFKGVRRLVKNRRPHLLGCPQKRAQCLKLTTFSPKKPNSAKRRVLKIVITSSKKKTYCYIPGIGHKLKPYAIVLIRGGRRLDIPGMKYTAIRGKYDFEPLYARRSARSKYGVRKYN